MHTDKDKLNALTEKIIGCAYKVGNTLGCGFLEKVYENAMVHELQKAGLYAQPQVSINVIYDGVVIGEYFGDILVEGLVLLELKTVKAFDEVHSAQCLNYLQATKLPVCLMINFAKLKIEIKRFAGKDVFNH